jgi:hypothetical protein
MKAIKHILLLLFSMIFWYFGFAFIFGEINCTKWSLIQAKIFEFVLLLSAFIIINKELTDYFDNEF